MTPVFCCGFECGIFGLNGQHFTQSNANISTSTVRSGSRSAQINITNADGQITSQGLASSSIWVIRVYVRFGQLPNNVCEIVTADFTGVYFNNADNKLYCGTGISGLAASGSAVISTNTWYRIDVKVDLSVKSADAQIDGSDIAQATSGAGSATTNFVLAVRNTSGAEVVTANVFFDDVVVSQTSGDYPIGAGYVNHFVPTADGTHNIAGANDFERTLTGVDITNATTDAYLLVDDIPLITSDVSAVSCVNMVAPANATDYVECQFGPAPGIGTPSSGPRAVEFIGTLQTASAGGSPTMDISLRTNDNGTISDVFTSSVFYQPSTPVFKRVHYATAPSTGTAWSATLFNAFKVRMGSFDAADTAPDGYFGTMMLEAEFEEIPVIANKIYSVNQAVKRAAYW